MLFRLKNLRVNNERVPRFPAVFLLSVFIFSTLVISTVLAGGQDRQRTAQPPRPAGTAPQTAPSQTPTPKRDTSGLGEAPPIPKLKPTPTPTPPEEIDPESTIKINADLVQLHVRVIDRNNRPIE